jgi:hypothetical protein
MLVCRWWWQRSSSRAQSGGGGARSARWQQSTKKTRFEQLDKLPCTYPELGHFKSGTSVPVTHHMHTTAHGCSHSRTAGACFTSWRKRRAAFTQVTVKVKSRPDTPLSRTRDFYILLGPSPVGGNVADSTDNYPCRIRHLATIRGLANDSVLDRFTQKWDTVS